MSHKSKVSLAELLKNRLTSKLAIGRSKAKDKKNNVDCRDFIYSWGSYKTYYKQGKVFLKWCKQKGFKCRTLEDCRPYCDQWLSESIERGLSPFTIKLYVATLSKIYSVSSDAFIKTPSRHRKDVFRSRKSAIRDKNVSIENCGDMISFLSSTGLRRNEAYSLRGNRLFIDNEGHYRIRINSGSKGGRPRDVLIIGDIDKVVSMMKAAGDGKVFESGIPSCLDVHHFRAIYAANLMNLLIKTQGIPNDPKDRYYCRRDMKGKVFSKKIMRIVSNNLGHGRIGVIAQAYLYQ